MNMTMRMRILTGLLASLVLAACSSNGDGADDTQVGERAAISHIHGLAVDGTGALYVATHFGLVKRGTDGSFVYASADRNDHMGFSLHPGEGMMYRSGHSPSRPSLGVESSTDGARWTHLSDVADPPVDFHAMAVSYADARTLWGWDSGGRGAFRSTDGGATWAALRPLAVEAPIYALAGPPEKDVVLAGSAGGLYRSRDGGSSWERVLGGGWTIGVAADPSDETHLLASTQRGLKLTTNDGATWSDTRDGIPDDVEIAHLAISPVDGDVAYAADASSIYETTDGARSWHAVSI